MKNRIVISSRCQRRNSDTALTNPTKGTSKVDRMLNDEKKTQTINTSDDDKKTQAINTPNDDKKTQAVEMSNVDKRLQEDREFMRVHWAKPQHEPITNSKQEIAKIQEPVIPLIEEGPVQPEQLLLTLKEMRQQDPSISTCCGAFHWRNDNIPFDTVEQWCYCQIEYENHQTTMTTVCSDYHEGLSFIVRDKTTYRLRAIGGSARLSMISFVVICKPADLAIQQPDIILLNSLLEKAHLKIELGLSYHASTPDMIVPFGNVTWRPIEHLNESSSSINYVDRRLFDYYILGDEPSFIITKRKPALKVSTSVASMNQTQQPIDTSPIEFKRINLEPATPEITDRSRNIATVNDVPSPTPQETLARRIRSEPDVKRSIIIFIASKDWGNGWAVFADMYNEYKQMRCDDTSHISFGKIVRNLMIEGMSCVIGSKKDPVRIRINPSYVRSIKTTHT